MTKTMEAIQHITAGELADDPDKAIEEFDMAAALIDELSSSLTQQQDEPEVADAGEDEPEPEEGDGGGQPEDDEPAEGGVRGTVSDKAGMMGEKVESVKESIPTPPTPLALAGLGIVAALATLSALKVLSGRSGGAEGE
jgi:hypothetical protein